MRQVVVGLLVCAACGDGTSDVEAPVPCVPFHSQSTGRFLMQPVRTASGWGIVDSDHNYRHVDDAGVVSAATALPDMKSRTIVSFDGGLAYAAYSDAGLEVVTFDETATALSRSEPLPVTNFTGVAITAQPSNLVVAYSEGQPEMNIVNFAVTAGWSGVSKLSTGNFMEPVAMVGSFDLAFGGFSPGVPQGCPKVGPSWNLVKGLDCGMVYTDRYTPIASDGSVALVGHNHKVWTTATESPSSLFEYTGHVGIAWTGAFWELIVTDAAGSIEERRLDSSFATVSSTTLDATVVPTSVQVGADADRALIVASDEAGETDLIQVCY